MTIAIKVLEREHEHMVKRCLGIQSAIVMLKEMAKEPRADGEQAQKETTK